MLTWVQNEYAERARYWRERGELEAHTFRKGYMDRFWHTERVAIGPPQPTEARTAAELDAACIVGLYAERRKAPVPPPRSELRLIGGIAFGLGAMAVAMAFNMRDAVFFTFGATCMGVAVLFRRWMYDQTQARQAPRQRPELCPRRARRAPGDGRGA